MLTYGWFLTLIERFTVYDPELRWIKRKARKLRRLGHSIGLKTDEEIIAACYELDMKRRGL